jgi:hypothetical protein
VRSKADKGEHEREVVVIIHWRQWKDGRWEARIMDESEHLLGVVYHPDELVRWLKRASGSKLPPDSGGGASSEMRQQVSGSAGCCERHRAPRHCLSRSSVRGDLHQAGRQSSTP